MLRPLKNLIACLAFFSLAAPVLNLVLLVWNLSSLCLTRWWADSHASSLVLRQVTPVLRYSGTWVRRI